MCGQLDLVQIEIGKLKPAKKPIRPNLKMYDWIVLNSSAGKDSQVMIDEVFRTAVEEGVEDRLVVVHADLGRVEWPGTKELAAQQASMYGLPFFVVKRPQGDLLEHVRQRAKDLHSRGIKAAAWMRPDARFCTSDHKRGQLQKVVTALAEETRRSEAPPWPSPKVRYCTSDHKRGQIAKILTNLAKEARKTNRKRKPRILNCFGIRAEESPSRSKLKPFQLDRRQSGNVRKDLDGKRVFVPGRSKTVHTWLPIHGWSVDQVWSRIRESGVPYHFAYDLGMPRLSCCFCIFAPRSALLLAGKHNRELLREYVKVEKEVGYAFRENLALADIEAALERGEEAGTITSWAM